MDAKLITNVASQLTDAELTEIAKIITSELRSRNSDPEATTPNNQGRVEAPQIGAIHGNQSREQDGKLNKMAGFWFKKWVAPVCQFAGWIGIVVANSPLGDGDGPGTSEDLSFREASVFDDQASAAIIGAIGVQGDERFDFGIDRSLQHASGSFFDDFIQGTALVELGPKGDHFGIEFVAHWHVGSVCFNLVHGVFLCPLRAVGGLKFQQDAPPFSSIQEHNFRQYLQTAPSIC